MTECYTQINEIKPWLYEPPREGDFFLMDIILRSETPKDDQEIFNRVRLNLKIITASDIVIADSRSKILPNILEGVNERNSAFNWPENQQLPKKWYDIFGNILKTVIRSQLHSTPLGKWVGKGHQRWKNYCDSQNNIIAKEIDEDISGLTPVDITRRRTTRIIGQQYIVTKMKTIHRHTSPLDSLHHPAPWISFTGQSKINSDEGKVIRNSFSAQFIDGTVNTLEVGYFKYLSFSDQWRLSAKHRWDERKSFHTSIAFEEESNTIPYWQTAVEFNRSAAWTWIISVTGRKGTTKENETELALSTRIFAF